MTLVMDSPDRSRDYILWWITSLALSVVCCAVLFVVFAGYLMEMKENLTVHRIQVEMLDQRMSLISTDVRDVRRRSAMPKNEIEPASMPAMPKP
jgi:hypothetical protein